MGWFYKISDKQLLEIRNKIFIESGIPALEKNGFTRSPLSTAWFGRNNLGDYTYDFCRVAEGSQLEMIVTHISRGDNWIKTFLNIFKLYPEIKVIEKLNGVDGLRYGLLPNSLTEMQLRMDDFKGLPLFNYHFMFGGHKIKSFKTERGLNKRIQQLSSLIEKDLTNIDFFYKEVVRISSA